MPHISTMDLDLFFITLPSQSSIPQHPSTPRSISTDSDEFYGLFPFPKPFKANPVLVKTVNQEGGMAEKMNGLAFYLIVIHAALESVVSVL
ncbi:1107_t:CDS:2 [Dentiscutata erythropus]|uniref:1107_t:CDS:1 n=1 Tax=Dentiscutata erythropus TaxID=1348616 RepID=A0A9N8YRV1_9GLOM|nr:1107_t:CDS:2 [Dentiscutata erythropus]